MTGFESNRKIAGKNEIITSDNLHRYDAAFMWP